MIYCIIIELEIFTYIYNLYSFHIGSRAESADAYAKAVVLAKEAFTVAVCH